MHKNNTNGREDYLILNIIADLIWEIDNKGLLIYLSPKINDLLGYTLEESIGMPFYRFLAEEDIKQNFPLFKSMENKQEPFVSLEITLLKKDGRKLKVEVSGIPLFDCNNQIKGWKGIVRNIGTQKNARVVLQKSEEKWRSLVECAPNMIFIIDRCQNIQFINQTPAGFAKEEVIGKHISSFIDPPDYQVAKKSIEYVYKTGNPSEYIVRGMGADNRIAWYETHLGPIKEDGQITDLLLIVTDITSRMESEETLRESEKNYRSLYEGSRDGYVLVDMKGRIKKYNKAYIDMLGYFSEPELLNTRYKERTPEKWHAYEKEIVQSQVLKNGYSEIYEKEYIKKDGTIFPVELRAYILNNKTGDPIGIWSFVRDITDRKQAEKALKDSEQRYRIITETISDMVWEMDQNGILTYVSQKSKSLMGYESNELIGKSYLDLFPEDEATRIAVYSEKTIKYHKPFARFEARCLHKNGRTVYTESSGVPIFDMDGKFMGWKGIERDITERKQAENELKRYRDHLEQLVKERTDELEIIHSELLEKEKLATLGQLISTVSHEIRNPLGTIRTSVFSIGDALEQNQMDRVYRALKLAERNIKRCDGIITELLDFIRNRELNLTPVDIDTWLNSLLDENIFLTEMEFVRDLHSGTRLPVDIEHLRRAIINVINNAAQALKEQKTSLNTIKIETHIINNRLEILIVDQGPGIPEENLNKIFTPLFSTKSFGIGLGLSIVKEIMDEHGGGIDIHSQTGKGTTIVLWLPLKSGTGENS